MGERGQGEGEGVEAERARGDVPWGREWGGGGMRMGRGAGNGCARHLRCHAVVFEHGSEHEDVGGTIERGELYRVLQAQPVDVALRDRRGADGTGTEGVRHTSPSASTPCHSWCVLHRGVVARVCGGGGGGGRGERMGTDLGKSKGVARGTQLCDVVRIRGERSSDA